MIIVKINVNPGLSANATFARCCLSIPLTCSVKQYWEVNTTEVHQTAPADMRKFRLKLHFQITPWLCLSYTKVACHVYTVIIPPAHTRCEVTLSRGLYCDRWWTKCPVHVLHRNTFWSLAVVLTVQCFLGETRRRGTSWQSHVGLLPRQNSQSQAITLQARTKINFRFDWLRLLKLNFRLHFCTEQGLSLHVGIALQPV